LSARERLEQYLDQVRQRLRAVVLARAGAAVAVTALLVTVIAVWMLREPGFPPSAVLAARIALVVSLIVAAVAMLWRPLLALHPRNRSKALERHLPAQGGRLETYMELARRRERGEPAPLIDLLAEDALAVAEQAPPETAVPGKRLWIPAAIAGGAVALLVGLMAIDGLGFGFGSRHLWFGAAIPKEAIVAKTIRVKPGDATIRRNQDVPIQATIQGFSSKTADVYVRFGDSKTYERAPMKVTPTGEFEFTLYALREPLSYYVESQGAKSAEHRIFVADVPRVEKMRITYNYPSWTGLAPETDESYRDIRAVAGTKVEIEVETSAPLDSPTLKVNGASAELKREGNWSRGTLELKEEGTYRIHAKVGDEHVPLTDEYRIALVEDQKPTIEIARPGRDWQASSIEEVPIRVTAKDDFRVQNVELHYSVNGGEWKVRPLKGRGKEVTDSTLLSLEELAEGGKQELQATLNERLTPGDIVSYYAVAKDRKQTVQTDLFLINVQPFERRFTQGQAGGAGGGGGGGDDQQAISQRQREILLATWNLQRLKADSRGREAERIADNARMLSELQGTLADQARTLVERAQARGVDNADEKNKALIENLQLAVQAMAPAAKHLGDSDFPKAVPAEQKALQHLLRAEALYSDIELQFRQAQNGGGGGNQAGRDLAEMFELEMDLEKNQYETESRASKEQTPQQLADAIQKLRELARRQEQLARQQAQQQAPRESDKWRQEQLKREAEQLRKQLEQLAQQGSQSPNGQGQSQGGESQSQNGQGQSQGSAAQRAARNAANNALNELQQAIRNMEESQGGKDQQQRVAQASRNLKEALEKMEQGRRDGASGSFDDLANRAQRMVEQQREQQEEMLSAYARGAQQAPGAGDRSRPGLSWEQAEAMAEKKRSLQQQLESLQRDMQASARAHREDAPQASENIAEASRQLAESGLSSALSRSAMEIERGRGLQAAARERLITEAMNALANDLSRAAQVAANESQQRRKGGPEEATPEELLAELGELRRAWQQAQAEQQRRLAEARGQGRDPNAGPGGELDPNNPNAQQRRLAELANRQGGRDPQGRNQNGQQPGDSPGQEGPEGQSGAESQQAGGQQGGANSGGSFANNGGANGGNWGGGGPDRWLGGTAGHWIEGDRGRLGNWNPPLPSGALRPVDPEEFRRQAEAFARRFRELANRIPEGALPDTEIAALRQLANRLREAGGRDPMENEYARMLGLVDQLELAALNATEKNRAVAATRASRPVKDSPEYRETVAEYYRRLGGGETK
jgi:hypothetical protein